MNMRFLQVGSRLFAIDHIVAVVKVPGTVDRVRLWTVNDVEPWLFQGNEATALWSWAESTVNREKLS